MTSNRYICTPKHHVPEPPSTNTHHNPGQALAESLLAWLTDGAPMPESGQNK
ncbi:hypothetical protein [Neosynechococcus sphagnicola]|uniref:hypothetical protein n=1 Tax=Neosynechococcus sphagnicola TaxID=1501145 RepID=UPI0012E04125|nr:hypothetical protein [Neosynechococcus sphagnicola]